MKKVKYISICQAPLGKLFPRISAPIEKIHSVPSNSVIVTFIDVAKLQTVNRGGRSHKMKDAWQADNIRDIF